MTTQHPSASRTRLPILMAAWLFIIAATVTMSSGLPGVVQAQAERGAIPSLTLHSSEPGQLVITWETPDPAPTDYRLRWTPTNENFLSYRDVNEVERGNLYPLGGVTSLTLNNLTPGESYKVQMRSRYYNADRSVRESSGPWTNTATQRVKDHPPAEPTGLAASQVEHNRLTLSWNDPQDARITGYRVLRGTDADSLSTIQADTGSPSTNYTDSTVEPETSYHYAVLAMSQDGEGAQSDAMSVTTLAEPVQEPVENDPPEAPTGLTASNVAHNSLTLTWNDPQDDSITGYRILRGDAYKNLAVINSDTASNTTEYEDDTVAPKTAYHYAVLARSANGEGTQSDIISATTPAAPKSKDPPPQRVGPRAAAGAPAITAPNAFRVPAVLGVDLSGITDTEGTTGIATTATYNWQRFNAAGTTLDTDSIGTVSTYTLTDADANKRLKVVVSFIDDAGNSEGPLTSAAEAIYAAATDCNAPTLTGGATFLGPARKLAVGKINFLGTSTIGFLKTSGSGSLDNATFTTAGSSNYEIVAIANHNNVVVRLDTDLTAADKSTLVLHICDQAYAFDSSSSSNADYQFQTPSQDLSPHAERTIYLSQDTVAPTFTRATVNGTSLAITLSEYLGAAASLDNTDFAVKKNGSTTPLSTTTPVILGNTVTLTLTTAVAATDTNVLVTYTKPTSGTANKLMDRFGNQVETFTDEDAIQHQTLVSNIGQANNSGTTSTTHDLAQAFTTGANDTGYTLTSIDMFLWSLNGFDTPPTVTLHSGSASGTKVADFTGPSAIGPGDVSYAFILATPVRLNASTEYWVVAEGATSHWNSTFSETEDGSGAPGWTIADLGQRRQAGTGMFNNELTTSYQLRINGTVNPLPVTLVSNLSQTADQNATYSRDHGQAFTTGNNSTGYSVTNVTIVSRDPNNDAIPLQICEVDGSVHPTTVCTDLTPPDSYPQGNLTYTVPTTTPLTLNATTTYMLVFKAPVAPTMLRVAATSSDDQDAASLTGFSIANAFQWYNTSNTWVIGNFGRAIRITIAGKVNQTAPGPPTDLSATARGGTKINLSWTAPDSSGITGYKIESSSDAGSNWSDLVADTGNTNTAYQHTGLSRGDTRHYRVSAINSVGTSAPSNTANATTATVTDTTAPTVTSITRQDPTSSPTNSDNLTWRVTFSEAVESLDAADFMVTGTTATLTVTAITSMTDVYDVTASGGDLASLDGTVTLAFAADQNIVDPSDNTLTATTPTGANDPTFELDNTVPTFLSGTANGTLIVLTFSEDLDPNSLPPGEAFDVSALGNFSAPQPVVNSVAIEGTMVTLTVTPALFTDHTVTVSNNAYDDGIGRVPLKDFAGNAVQPAATVGSYSVTNETPIGPPASLRAEAGDGRVRLLWTGPAGVDFQTAYHQYRYAPGTSVPEETDWTETTNLGNLTTLVQGLANGTPHAFEVRAIRGSEVGATATVSATPLTGVCSTPDLGDRREVWSATLTVGRSISSQGQTSAGYRRGELGSLSQDGDRIIISGTSYTIEYIFTVVRTDGDRRQLFLELVDLRKFTSAAEGALRFHWCSDSSGFDDSFGSNYRVSNDNQADWSLYNTRELALSLPANNDATGTPDITGRALPGQTLTAGTGNVADADGLPQNASDFAWQWIRIADETDTPIQDATSSTYTLTDDDVGKQVKVVMSFTDSLSGVESLTSDAYPSSSTVQRVLVSNIGQTVITQNDNAGELAILDSAQEFTTGSNETGYTMSSIDLELTVANTSNFPVVKLFSGSATGTEVATLTAPTNASTGKTTYTFTVPTAITLEGDTSYWVMAETGGGTWHTVGFAEDATPAPGWSIADGDEFRGFDSTGPFTTDTLVALMIRVNGTVNNPFLENFRADAGNAQVTLRWDNPEDSSITRYQYRQRLTSERVWDPDWTDIPSSGASTTSYTVGNLANWTPYTFQLRAVRGNEPTATSAATATPEGPPSAPRNLTARGQDQGITAWWQTPPAGDEQAPVTSYKVRYRQVGTSPWQNVTRANDDRSATQEINNLTNRQHYEVQVAAVNRVGTGQWASVKATPQAPDSPPPAPTGDAALTLGILGLFWDNSPTGNTLWADTCTGSRSFRIIWDGPKGHDRAADEWAAHINTSGGAGEVTHDFREIPIRDQEGDEDTDSQQHSGYYEMYGTVNFEGNGSLSVNVRGRFGETWGTWSPTGSLYCYTTEKPSRN